MKKQKRLLIVLLACIFIASLLLTGCGPSEDPADADPSGEGTGEVTKGGTAVVALYAVCYTYDPQKTTSYGDWSINNHIYDTLVTLDFDGQTIVPSLATDWTVSEDGMTYTFNLRDDVKFHSGKAMTAADVKYTFERWMDPDTASPTKEYIVNIASVEAPDDYTFVIHMAKPDNNILLRCASTCAGILNQESVEAGGESYGTSVVDGTGPFRFKEYIQDDRTILERFEEYTWGPEIFENQGPAYLEQLVYRFIPEAGTRAMEYQAGNIDIMANATIFASELETISVLDFYGIENFSPIYPVFLQFHLDNGPDEIIRKACNMAVDREELIQTVVGGFATPMYGAMPPDYWEWMEGREYYPHNDIDAANAYLEENGYILADDGYRYKDGQQATFTVIHCSSNEDKKICEILQAQMKKIGVNVVVDSSRVSQFWSFINTNEYECLVMSAQLFTPEDMLGRYLDSANLPFPNRQGFSNERVDELLSIALQTTDPVERQACYDEIQEIALETTLWLPIYNRNGFLVYNNNLKGLRAHSTLTEGIPKALDLYKEVTE